MGGNVKQQVLVVGLLAGVLATASGVAMAQAAAEMDFDPDEYDEH